MNSIILGSILGTLFGLVVVLTKIPREVENKKASMLGALTNRFAIGFLIGTVSLPLESWLNGIIVGTLVSLPHMFVTKEYHVLTFGVLGGAVIGFIVGIV